MMRDRAYAKINLGLDVVGVRDDGYHELNMIMVPVNFYDVLEMEVADEMSMEQSVGYIPIDEKNTVIKAINVLREEYGFKENFKIKLTKHIPTQAGMAGGSSDGASAMRLVNKLLNLNIPRDKMIQLATRVGADVAFCLLNECAQVKGIGDILEPFDVNCDFEILLVKPRKGVSTKAAFDMVDNNPCFHPNIEGLREALENDDYQGVCSLLGNSLDEAGCTLSPRIKKIKSDLLKLGFDGVLMTGSGSTVFGITRNKELLQRANDIMRKQGYFVRMTKIFKNY